MMTTERFKTAIDEIFDNFEVAREEDSKRGKSPYYFVFNIETGEFIIHVHSHYRKTTLEFLKSIPNMDIDPELEQAVKDGE